MRKYLWGIVAGVFVLALLAVGVIFLPPLIMNHPSSGELDEGQMVLMPGHWWKMEITEQQRNSLATLWGRDMSTTELLRELWPEVLQQLPQEALAVYEKRKVGWPVDAYEEWTGTMLSNCGGSSIEMGATVCCVYLGSREDERYTFKTVDDRGFTEEKTYRVSIYTSDKSPQLAVQLYGIGDIGESGMAHQGGGLGQASRIEAEKGA